jgi:hypothetical protein
MKTITLNAITIGKKMVITLLMAVCTVSLAVANTGDSTINKEDASVSCLKVEEGNIYFNVKFQNADGGRFHLLVNDAVGDNLYHATFTGQHFDKVFRAPSDNGKLTIIIRDVKDKTNHTFELTTESKLVQQIYVKRM